MINIGVIGCGHWGPNHIRVFSGFKNSHVLMCSDLNEKRLKSIKDSFPTVAVTKNYFEILENESIDAVVVATPTKTHYEIVKNCLLSGKDVLCEKPMSTTVAEAEELVQIAEEKDRILMVGHIFLFNSGIQKLKEYIDSGELGRIYYVHSERTNLGPIRDDVNVVYDLASHDISICSHLLSSNPTGVEAKGEDFIREGVEDVAFISLSYPGKVLANIHVSWLDPRKVREITVVGDRKMAIWNDMNNIEPIRLYDKGVVKKPYYNDFGEFHLQFRDSDITIPKLKLVEPLKNQGMYFIQCIEKREIGLCSGAEALSVVKVLEEVEKCLKRSRSSQQELLVQRI